MFPQTVLAASTSLNHKKHRPPRQSGIFRASRQRQLAAVRRDFASPVGPGEKSSPHLESRRSISHAATIPDNRTSHAVGCRPRSAQTPLSSASNSVRPVHTQPSPVSQLATPTTPRQMRSAATAPHQIVSLATLGRAWPVHEVPYAYQSNRRRSIRLQFLDRDKYLAHTAGPKSRLSLAEISPSQPGLP